MDKLADCSDGVIAFCALLGAFAFRFGLLFLFLFFRLEDEQVAFGTRTCYVEQVVVVDSLFQ
jgi:hypothetical protein